ncbi:MAG: iron ABC transporter permease [Andreesenia angusta]|nr:iron ABC transporter permease [Andreesenia angusta]
METNKRGIIAIIVSLAILGVIVFISAGFGGADLSAGEVIEAFKNPKELDVNSTIVLGMRVPRTIIAFFVGAMLAVSGALLQVVIKNPLGDPGITGISAGASLFAVVIIFYFPSLLNFTPLFAFIGAVVACLVVFSLSWKRGLDTTRIILAGIAVNAVFLGGTSLLTFMNGRKVQDAMQWLNGSVANKGWGDAKSIIIYGIIGIILSLFCIKAANILLLGDDVAKSIGVNVTLLRFLLGLVAVYLVGVSTAIAGVISFVGLIVPHTCRLIVGMNYKYVIPLSMILGAMLLVLTDMVGRTAFSPLEFPVGILMAIIGSPVFLFLLKTKGKY